MFRRSASEMRVLILAPVGRDAALLAQTVRTLSAEPVIVANAADLLKELANGVGASILADEAIRPNQIHELTAWLAAEPPWSDPPFIILTPAGQTKEYSHQRS